MSDVKILLLNGPPRCGKDTAANYINEHLKIHKKKFATTVKDGVHAALNLDVHSEFYEDKKDEHLSEFYGLTPREAYIKHSEVYMKPVYGNNIFSKLFIRHIEEIRFKKIIVSDCGFQIELDTLIKRYGLYNIGLVHIHREGTTFTGDSRKYITSHPGLSRWILCNEDLVNFCHDSQRIAQEFFELD